MRQVPKEKQSKKTLKFILPIIIIMVVVYILMKKDYIPTISMVDGSENGTLKQVKDITELDVSQNNEVIVNKEQVVIATKDGVKAISLEGEEVWADTHTLSNISLVQSSPYFAIGEKMGYQISVYDDHGKKSDIQFSNPVGYFSLNELGDLVVVENTVDGHVVSAYNAQGESLGVKRITYTEDSGYPITAEISPDGTMILVGYLDTSGVVVASNIVGIKIGSDSIDDDENILYGRTYEDTLVSEIEFIDEDKWVLVGDNMIAFNNVNGEETRSIDGVYTKRAPALSGATNWYGVIYAVISSGTPTDSAVHSVEEMGFFDQSGEEIVNIPLENQSTYMCNDGKIVIVGSGREFIGYNRMGKIRWEYTATKDIQSVVQLSSDNQVVMVSKGKVELMQVVK